jgi:hypothetical protein
VSRILIDSPVSAFSPRAEIEAWIQRLEELGKEYAGDAGALEDIRFALASARRDLKMHLGHGRPVGQPPEQPGEAPAED